MPSTAFIPASLLLQDVGTWPAGTLEFDGGMSVLDRVGIISVGVTESAGQATARFTVVFDDEIALTLPGLSGVSLVLGGSGSRSEFAIEVYLREPIAARLINAGVSLRFASSILRPVRRIDGGFELDPSRPYVEIAVTGSVVFADDRLRIDGMDGVSLPLCMIGDSGLAIEATSVILDLSRTSSIQHAEAAGLPASWMGIFMTTATLYLPPDLTSAAPRDLHFENCFIGSGGFTGNVDSVWDPAFSGSVCGVDLLLRAFGLTIEQSVIVTSRIHGELVLPFFDQPVGVDLALGLSGDFTVGLSAVQPPGVTRSADGLIELEMADILRLTVASLAFEKRGDDFLIKLSGSIKLLYGDFNWPEVEVRELSIDKDGHIHIEGGWLELPESASFSFGGFAMELTKIGFGNDDGWKWVGFSGQISLVDELSFSASVGGLKTLWRGGETKLQFDDIKVDLEIPGAISFEGFVSYSEDDSTFKGNVKLVLETPEIAFDAHLKVGRTTAFSFLHVYIDATLPAGIPLGQTNLAIYGFAGLFANNVTPKLSLGNDIPDADEKSEWFRWYLAPPIGTTDDDKWNPTPGPLALGAGVTLGTAADDGFAISAKTLLVLLFPGPLLLIDGKGNLLKDRSELAKNKQGTYQALAVLDGRAGTFLINIEPHFEYPPMDPGMGSMLDVTGVAEGFFDFHNPDAWHIYLGQDPPAKRIRGVLVKLLNVDAYLMLDHAGMRLGASTGIDKHYDFGPLGVALKAVIEGEASVSWRPTQLDGKLTIEGLAALRAFGCSASVCVDAALAIETPHPFHVAGDVRVKLKTPWPLRDPSARIRFKWGGGTDDTPRDPPTVASLAAEHLRVTESWSLEPTVDTSPLDNFDGGTGFTGIDLEDEVPSLLIPLDAKLVIAFSRPVVDRALIGCNGGPAPHPERVGAFEVAHELLGITLEKRDGASWAPVSSRQNGAGDLFGMWLPLPEGDQAAGKLQLWGCSPFTYTRNNTSRTYVDWFTDQNPAYPCIPDEPAEPSCVDFDTAHKRVFPPLFIVGDLVFEFLYGAPLMRPVVSSYTSTLTGTSTALMLSYLVAIPLRITPSAPAAALSVFLSLPANQVVATLRAFRDGQVVASATSEATRELELKVAASGIEYVTLTAQGPKGPLDILVLRVCVTLQAQQDRAEQVSLIRGRLQEQLSPGASWCGEDHLLEANSVYRLTVTTQIRKWRDGQELDATTHDDVSYYRTKGPPGFFEPKGPPGFETQAPLRDLSAYVDPASSVPRNGARPVYRSYDLRLVFDVNYMERLYKGTGHDLSIVLRDQNGQGAQSVTGALVQVTTEWDRDPYKAQSAAQQQWIWTIGRPGVASAGCTPDVGNECVVKRSSLEARLRETPLAPLALIETRIVADDALSEPLHHFSFTTSRFVTFIHHIQSFSGVVSDHPLGTNGQPALTADQLTRLSQVIQARQEAGPALDSAREPLAFDEVAGSLFGLGRRLASDRVDIMLLHDDSRRYGLLLESPEPLDWLRTTLGVRRATSAAPDGIPAKGSVAIINAALPPATTSEAPDFNAEWVEVLLKAEASMSGWVMEHSGGLELPTVFTPYYRFGEEVVMPEGTLIRVHSGMESADVAPAPERTHRYVTPPGETGVWHHNVAGDVLRLVDPDGAEIQRWSVLPDSAFQDLTPVIIRNADQTRALLFFSQSADVPVSDVPEGRLRMAWGFKRDAGHQLPVFRRWGDSSPEETIIEFELSASA